MLHRHGSRARSTSSAAARSAFADEIDLAFGSVIVQCAVRELGRSSTTTSERILDDHGNVLVEAEFGLGALGSRAARVKADHDQERASLAAAEEVAG